MSAWLRDEVAVERQPCGSSASSSHTGPMSLGRHALRRACSCRRPEDEAQEGLSALARRSIRSPPK